MLPKVIAVWGLLAIAAGIGKIICLTEHVPLHDTMYVLAAARERGAQVLGPNTAGVVTVG